MIGRNFKEQNDQDLTKPLGRRVWLNTKYKNRKLKWFGKRLGKSVNENNKNPPSLLSPLRGGIMLENRLDHGPGPGPGPS